MWYFSQAIFLKILMKSAKIKDPSRKVYTNKTFLKIDRFYFALLSSVELNQQEHSPSASSPPEEDGELQYFTPIPLPNGEIHKLLDNNKSKPFTLSHIVV
jgi:hypothetical protein